MNNNKLIIVQRVILGLAIICLVFLALPIVSVRGIGLIQQVDLRFSMIDFISDAKVLLFLYILCPAVSIVAILLKKTNYILKGIIITLSMVVNIVLWIFAKSAINDALEEIDSAFVMVQFLPAFYISVMLFIALSVLGIVLAVYEKVAGDSSTLSMTQKAYSQADGSDIIKHVSDAISQVAGNVSSVIGKKEKMDIIGYCFKCGAPLKYGNQFCISCGTPIPESLLEEAEAEKRAQEEKRLADEEKKARESLQSTQQNEESATEDYYCPYCGKKNTGKITFCGYCGERLNG